MTPQEMATALDGRQYRDEMTKAEEALAKEHGLVVIFGASDDLMELRGAVHDEIGAYGGADAHFTKEGFLQNNCEDEDCPYFQKLLDRAVTVEAKWDSDGYSWTYKTAIPHATFDILEDDEKYCRGIVFALADISA